jgi:four helix bundle suffix protein
MERRKQRNGTNRTNGTDRPQEPRLIPPHGGYHNLKSYQTTEIIFDATNAFCNRFINPRSRTYDQMVQAARSGKQNIAEASQTSGTSKKSELRLVDVARASLQELLEDYKDFLRLRKLPIWDKEHSQAVVIRNLAYRTDRTYETYRTYVEESPPEVAANTMVCLVNQANFLLDRQLESLERTFLNEGGFTERLYNARRQQRSHQSYPSHKSYPPKD